jgi:hypothetical protein
MNLYNIANEYQNIFEQTFDTETGEINENALACLAEVKSTIQEKGIAVASYIKNIDAERKAIEEAKKAMAEREKRLDNRVNYLTQYLQSNMERCGINEIKSPYFVVKLKKCPFSTEIWDENLIPNDYKKTKEVMSIDRIKIKEEILAGVVVPGASLKQNNRLDIR